MTARTGIVAIAAGNKLQYEVFAIDVTAAIASMFASLHNSRNGCNSCAVIGAKAAIAALAAIAAIAEVSNIRHTVAIAPNDAIAAVAARVAVQLQKLQ